MKKIDEVKEIAKKCLKCQNPSCVKRCPLGNDIPHILKEFANNNIEKAKAILLNTTFSSLICAKLCDFKRSCYGGCILNNTKHEAIPFYEVEDYLASLISANDFQIKDNPNSKKIAIIGAGISGISASILFRMSGHLVTLFERNDKIGGVITDSLPEFRYDSKVISRYQDILEHLGVKINLNVELSKNLFITDLEEFDVILFAMGTPNSKRLFPNDNDIYDGMDILRKAKRKENYLKNRNVIVIGGGNVAMDVARTLIRNANTVTIVYRRDLENAPASQSEIQEAIEEGVQFRTLLAPVHPLYENNKLVGLKTEITKIVDKNDGSRKSFLGTGDMTAVLCDAIVEAVGLDADYAYLKEQIPTLFSDIGWIKDDGIVRYNHQIIATCGDYLIGASTFAKSSKNTLEIVSRILEMMK